MFLGDRKAVLLEYQTHLPGHRTKTPESSSTQACSYLHASFSLAQKDGAVRRTETKDGSSYDFTQCSHRGEKPTCLLRSTCPCPSVTAHLVCNYHTVACPPFVSPSSPFLLLLPVYSQMISFAITVRSQSLISKCKSRTRMQCFLCRPKALLLPGNCPQPFLIRIPARQVLGAVAKNIGDNAHRVLRRVNMGAARNVLLQD
jgi:hypothetical protein